MNRVMSHVEFTSVRVCVCARNVQCASEVGCVCVERESNASLKAPSCSLLHISPIMTTISPPLPLAPFHFFPLHQCRAAPSLPALSANSASLPSLYADFFFFPPSPLNECGMWGPLHGFSCIVAIRWQR